MHRSALRLHSRDHDSSIRVACRSRAPCRHGGGPLRFCAHRSAWRLRSRHYGRSVPAAHGSQPLERNARGALSFLCAARVPHESRRGSCGSSRRHDTLCGRGTSPLSCRPCAGATLHGSPVYTFPSLRHAGPVPASPYTVPPADQYLILCYLHSFICTAVALEPAKYADLQYLNIEYSNLAF